jgi:hypothetical protein
VCCIEGKQRCAVLAQSLAVLALFLLVIILPQNKPVPNHHLPMKWIPVIDGMNTIHWTQQFQSTMYICQEAHFRALLRPDTTTYIHLSSSVERFASMSCVPAYDGDEKVNRTCCRRHGKPRLKGANSIPHAQGSSTRCSITTVSLQ